MIDYTTFPINKLIPELEERDIQINQLEKDKQELINIALDLIASTEYLSGMADTLIYEDKMDTIKIQIKELLNE